MFGKDYELNVEFFFTCPREFIEGVCEECEYYNYKMVGHPGGSSCHSTESYFCDLGYWEDDF